MNLILLPLDVGHNLIQHIHTAVIRHLVAPMYFLVLLIERCFSQVNYLKLILKSSFPQDMNLIPLPLDVGHSATRYVHIALMRHFGPLVFFFNIAS